MAFIDQFFQPDPPDGSSYNMLEAICWWNDPSDPSYIFVRFEHQPNSPVRFVSADWEAAYSALVPVDPAASLMGTAYTLNSLSLGTLSRASQAFDPRAMAFVPSNTHRRRYMAVGGTPILADFIERDATNLFTTSESFADFTLTNLSQSAVSDPAGGLTALRLTSGAGPNSVQTNVTPLDAGFPMAFSLYVRRVTGSPIEQISVSHPSVVGDALFDLDAQTVTLGGWQAGNIEQVNAAGWYRIWCRFTVGAPGAAAMSWSQLDSGGLPAAGALDVWGAQIERNYYATSYVQTSGAVASRVADDLVLDLGSLATGAEGTWMALAAPYTWDESQAIGGGSNTLFQSESPAVDFYLQRHTSTSLLNVRSSHEGAAATTSQVSGAGGAGIYQPGTLLTAAVAWDATGTQAWANGVSLGTDGPPTLPFEAITRAQCGNRPDLAQAFDGWVSILSWDTRLTDPQILILHNAAVLV